jgi:deoxyxylulose-5-phosphate synthase
MSGLSLEALNDIGHRQTKMLIVLNDNEMSRSFLKEFPSLRHLLCARAWTTL